MKTYEPANPLLVELHWFLVRAAATEQALPSISKITLKTLWPEMATDRHVDYKPDRTRVTRCAPTGVQIDAHEKALEMVVEGQQNWMDRTIVWAVVQSAAYSGRGPRWTNLVRLLKKKPMPEDGEKWPKYEKALKSRYEEALLDIFCHLQAKN